MLQVGEYHYRDAKIKKIKEDMDDIEIIFPYEGLEEDLKSLVNSNDVELEYNSYSNFDGTMLCTVIGTAVNIGMFLMQAYTLWGNKHVKYVSKEFEIDDVTLERLIEYLKVNRNDK